MKILISLVVTIMVSAFTALLSDTIGQGLWVALVGNWSLYVIGAAAIAVPAFLLLVVPAFAWLRRSKQSLSSAWAFAAGAVIAITVIVVPAWIRGVSLSLSVLIAGAIGGGAGVATYARFQWTPFIRRVASGILVATAGTFVWAMVWSFLHNRRGGSPDLGGLL